MENLVLIIIFSGVLGVGFFAIASVTNTNFFVKLLFKLTPIIYFVASTLWLLKNYNII